MESEQNWYRFVFIWLFITK